MTRFSFLVLFFVASLTVNAQTNYDDLFAKDEPTEEDLAKNPFGYDWATMTGDSITIEVDGVNFRYPTAKFTSGKMGIIVVKGYRDPIYLHPTCVKDGKPTPMTDKEGNEIIANGVPVFRTHTNKMFQFKIGKKSGKPYSAWAKSSK